MNNTNPLYYIEEGRVLVKAINNRLLDARDLPIELFQRGSQLRKDVARRARGLMKSDYYGGAERQRIKNLIRAGGKPSKTIPGRESMEWLQSESGGDQSHILTKAIKGY